MKVDLIEMKKFISKNDLQEISNPVMYDKGYIPTTDGLLSTEIFGSNTKDRKDTYAYISLNGHFLHPFIYKMLKRMNRKFESLVYGSKNFVIKDGVLVEDEEGQTGLEFLYKNWKDIKFERNTSRIRNERIDLLEVSHKDEIFIEYWIVIPAFYRDMNLQKKSPGHHTINEYYSKLIRLSSILKSTNNFDFVLETTRGKVQQQLEVIYDELKSKIEKKQGLIKKSLLGKSIDYGARLVISAPTFSSDRHDEMEVDFYHTGVPLATCCTIFAPFIISWVKQFFRREFESRQNKYPITLQGKPTEYIELKNMELYFNDELIKKQLDRFVGSYSDRFETVHLPIPEEVIRKYGKLGNLILSMYGKYDEADPSVSSAIIERPLTWCDIFYRAAVDVTSDKYVYITRYPLLDYFGTFTTKVSVLSTRKTIAIHIGDAIYKNYPLIELDKSKEEISTLFIDTLVMSNLYLKGLGGDYDGDMVSIKGCFTQEANLEAAKIMTQKANILNVYGENVRATSNEGVQTLYMLTKFAK